MALQSLVKDEAYNEVFATICRFAASLDGVYGSDALSVRDTMKRTSDVEIVCRKVIDERVKQLIHVEKSIAKRRL
jgi:hypothetical protein